MTPSHCWVFSAPTDSTMGEPTQTLSFLSTLPKDRVALGSKVDLYEPATKREVSYELVIPEEAELSKGLVSVSSPIGQALLGHREGNKVSIRIPAGNRHYKIVKLRTLHDKAKD